MRPPDLLNWHDTATEPPPNEGGTILLWTDKLADDCPAHPYYISNPAYVHLRPLMAQTWVKWAWLEKEWVV